MNPGFRPAAFGGRTGGGGREEAVGRKTVRVVRMSAAGCAMRAMVFSSSTGDGQVVRAEESRRRKSGSSISKRSHETTNLGNGGALTALDIMDGERANR